MIDKLSNGKDYTVLDFAISKARETSWATAVMASNTPNFLTGNVIGIVDYAAAKVGSQIINPNILTLPLLVEELKKYESSDVRKNIEILASTEDI